MKSVRFGFFLHSVHPQFECDFKSNVMCSNNNVLKSNLFFHSQRHIIQIYFWPGEKKNLKWIEWIRYTVEQLKWEWKSEHREKNDSEMRFHLYSQQFKRRRFYFSFFSSTLSIAFVCVRWCQLNYLSHGFCHTCIVRERERVSIKSAKKGTQHHFTRQHISHSTISTVIKFYFYLPRPIQFECIFAIILRMAGAA